MALVTLAGIEAGHGGRVLVRLPAFTIERGAHTLLIGPSGSGKTTLLQVIAGIARPLAGTVCIDDQDLGALDESARDRFRGGHIGFIAQRLHLIHALSVGGNLGLVQRLAGATPDPGRIRTLLESLGVAHLADRRPGSLSQGEAQRVAIARALIHRPALVIADEPTSALDDANCAAVLTLMLDMAGLHGATLLIATHDARVKTHFRQCIELGAWA